MSKLRQTATSNQPEILAVDGYADNSNGEHLLEVTNGNT